MVPAERSNRRAALVARSLIAAAAAATCIASTADAAPVPCLGGTIDISAASDSLSVAPVVGTTFNVGQRTTLSAIASGFTPSSYAWTISGPVNLRDYEERVGNVASGSIAWSATPLVPADLAAASVSLYWKPSAGLTHPGNTPETRTATLTVNGGACAVTVSLTIERNTADAGRQAIDFYTSNHRSAAETNPAKGRVIDDHMEWHQISGSRLYPFLAWHGEFLRRFNSWRVEFGYPPETAWNPGTALVGGTEYQHSPRQASFDPLIAATPTYGANQIPTYYTIAGGTDATGRPRPTGFTGPWPAGGENSLDDYSVFNAFQNQFEFSWHGAPHCNIGTFDATGSTSFFVGSGPYFGSMCFASSPKDPIFWRWHGFIDLLYKNHCHVRGLACQSPADAATDLWMADNAADLAANGAPPSPSPRWISPDVWNRRTEPACTYSAGTSAAGQHPNSGVARDCGDSGDHENPLAGVENYLYVTLRNDRPSAARVAYAEVAIYIAPAATGLSWPADFTQLPQSRQLITLNLEPGQTTDIGPLRWVPPNPTPSDHFCLYVRILSPQDALNDLGSDEVANVDTNTANHNSIAWRNVTVAPAGSSSFMSMFQMRNIGETGDAGLTLRVDAPQGLLDNTRLAVALDPALARAWGGQGEGFKILEREELRAFGDLGAAKRAVLITSATATLTGIKLRPREAGAVAVSAQGVAGPIPLKEPIHFTQISSKGVDGGVSVMPGRAATASDECRGPNCRPRKIRKKKGYPRE